MRPSRVRPTVRGLMLAVLILAALLGAFEAGRRVEGNRFLRERQLAEAYQRERDMLRALRSLNATPAGTSVAPTPSRPE